MRVARPVRAVLVCLVLGSADAAAQQVTSISTIAGRIAGFDSSLRETHVAGNADGIGLVEATFRTPTGLAVDGDGNVLVCDATSTAPPFPGIVRIISPLLNHAPLDVDTRGTLLYTVGPSALLPMLAAPPSVPLPGASGITDIEVTTVAVPATGPGGNWVVAARGNEQVRVYSPSGGLVGVFGSGSAGLADGAAGVATFNTPTGVAVDSAGNVYVADQTNHAIRRIDAVTGLVTTVAGQATSRQFSADCTAACSMAVLGGFADGDATSVAQFRCPSGIAIGATDDELLVADTCNHRIRRVDLASGTVTTVAGSGAAGFADGAAGAAAFLLPAGVDRSPGGSVFVADSGNHKLRVIVPSGSVATVGRGESLTTDLFDVPGIGVLPPLVSPSDHFFFPSAVAVGGVGAAGIGVEEAVFVADTGRLRIRQVVRIP